MLAHSLEGGEGMEEFIAAGTRDGNSTSQQTRKQGTQARSGVELESSELPHNALVPLR